MWLSFLTSIVTDVGAYPPGAKPSSIAKHSAAYGLKPGRNYPPKKNFEIRDGKTGAHVSFGAEFFGALEKALPSTKPESIAVQITACTDHWNICYHTPSLHQSKSLGHPTSPFHLQRCHKRDR
jgi:hypothetical protein